MSVSVSLSLTLGQGCQVWPFRGQKNNLASLFKIGWPRVVENLLSSWPFLCL